MSKGRDFILELIKGKLGPYKEILGELYHDIVVLAKYAKEEDYVDWNDLELLVGYLEYMDRMARFKQSGGKFKRATHGRTLPEIEDFIKQAALNREREKEAEQSRTQSLLEALNSNSDSNNSEASDNAIIQQLLYSALMNNTDEYEEPEFINDEDEENSDDPFSDFESDDESSDTDYIDDDDETEYDDEEDESEIEDGTYAFDEDADSDDSDDSSADFDDSDDSDDSDEYDDSDDDSYNDDSDEEENEPEYLDDEDEEDDWFEDYEDDTDGSDIDSDDDYDSDEDEEDEPEYLEDEGYEGPISQSVIKPDYEFDSPEEDYEDDEEDEDDFGFDDAESSDTEYLDDDEDESDDSSSDEDDFGFDDDESSDTEYLDDDEEDEEDDFGFDDAESSDTEYLDDDDEDESEYEDDDEDSEDVDYLEDGDEDSEENEDDSSDDGLDFDDNDEPEYLDDEDDSSDNTYDDDEDDFDDEDDLDYEVEEDTAPADRFKDWIIKDNSPYKLEDLPNLLENQIQYLISAGFIIPPKEETDGENAEFKHPFASDAPSVAGGTGNSSTDATPIDTSYKPFESKEVMSTLSALDKFRFKTEKKVKQKRAQMQADVNRAILPEFKASAPITENHTLGNKLKSGTASNADGSSSTPVDYSENHSTDVESSSLLGQLPIDDWSNIGLEEDTEDSISNDDAEALLRELNLNF